MKRIYLFLFILIFILSCDLKVRTNDDVNTDPVHEITDGETPGNFDESENVFTFTLSALDNIEKKTYLVSVKENGSDNAESFSMRMKKNKGNTTSFYGMMLYKDGGKYPSFLAVLINSDGKIKIGKVENGSYKSIRAESNSGNLIKGLGSENILTISPSETKNKYELYINENKECDFIYSTDVFKGKSFGIIVPSNGNGVTEEVHFSIVGD